MIEQLTITGAGQPNPYSIRGLVQELRPIGERSQVRRTINAAAVDVGNAAFDKFESTLACEDMSAPVFEGVFPGKQLTIECVCDLGYDTAAGGSPARPVVPGTDRIIGGGTIHLYRPIITFLVVDWEMEAEVWGKVYAWALELTEA